MNGWICVEGRTSVGGYELEARVLVKGPGFRVGLALEGVEELGSRVGVRVDTQA